MYFHQRAFRKELHILSSIKGFPFYGVTLTYADSAHFGILLSYLAGPNSKICRICISQRDTIKRKPVSNFTRTLLNCFVLKTLCSKTKSIVLVKLLVQNKCLNGRGIISVSLKGNLRISLPQNIGAGLL